MNQQCHKKYTIVLNNCVEIVKYCCLPVTWRPLPHSVPGHSLLQPSPPSCELSPREGAGTGPLGGKCKQSAYLTSLSPKRIPKTLHMGDKASLDQCGQQSHQQQPSRLDQEYPKPHFFLNGRIIQNAKSQKCLKICQNQRYTL